MCDKQQMRSLRNAQILRCENMQETNFALLEDYKNVMKLGNDNGPHSSGPN